MKNHLSKVLCAIIMISIVSCGGKKETPPAEGTIKIGNTEKLQIKNSKFDGIVKEGTVEVSYDAMQNFMSADMETGVYKFTDDADEVESLGTGKVVLRSFHP